MSPVSDRLFRLFIWSSALLACTVILLIGVFLFSESLPALQHLGPMAFATDDGWFPLENNYHLTPMIYGTILIALGAMLFTIPISLCSAIAIVFYLPYRFRPIIERSFEILSGIPSVIFGLWGMLFIVPIILEIRAPGSSLLAGSIVLSAMLIPSLVLMFSLSFKQAVRDHYLTGLANGLSKAQVITKLIIPASRQGLSSAVFLQASRAVGETMAVLMVCGNVVQTPQSIFDPVRTLTTNAALEMAYAMDIHRSSLFVSGLVLSLTVAAILLLSKLPVWETTTVWRRKWQ